MLATMRAVHLRIPKIRVRASKYQREQPEGHPGEVLKVQNKDTNSKPAWKGNSDGAGRLGRFRGVRGGITRVLR